MRKVVRKYLIPHSENNYKPKMFEYAGLSVFLVVSVVFFLVGVSANKIIHNTEFGAAVYSSVLVDLTNESRKENNQSLLAINDKLTLAAQMKANDMAEKHYFAHVSPQGITPWFWMDQAHYTFRFAGENLAIDFNESKDVEEAWLSSPKHRENILDARFQEIGIATTTGFLEGKETTFVVQMFGTPAFAYVPEEPVAIKQNPSVDTKTTKQPVKVAISDTEVKGVSTQVEKISVITETPKTIVVENNHTLVNTAAAFENATSYSSSLDKAIIKIPAYVYSILLTLAGFLVLALLLFIFIEIKRQHPWRIFFGVALLITVLFLAYITKSYYIIAA